MAEVFFFLAAIGAVAGAAGTVMLRDAFYSRARARLPPDLPGDAVPAAARRVRRRGAGDRLRRRGDGALRLRRRLRRRHGGRRWPAPAAAALRIVSVLFAFALFVELAIALIGTGLAGARHRGRAVQGGRSASRPRSARLFLTTYLVAFEVASLLLLIAAVGAVILARRRSGLADPREISVADLMRTPS